MNPPEASTTPFRAVTERGRTAVEMIRRDPSKCLLACDFDGTLAPIVDDPSASRMLPRSRSALSRVAPRLGTFAIITGRPVATVRALGELDDQPGFESVVVLGQYGQEKWDAATGELLLPPEPVQVRAAIAELEALLAGDVPQAVTGTTLEDKGRAVGVHTRRAAGPDEALAWLEPRVSELAERHGLPIEPGRQVIELRSATTSKGEALAELVAEHGPGMVVMCGDDLGDIPAFEYLHGLEHGICVVAGSAEQPEVARHADVLCDGPEGVAAWFEELV